MLLLPRRLHLVISTRGLHLRAGRRQQRRFEFLDALPKAIKCRRPYRASSGCAVAHYHPLRV